MKIRSNFRASDRRRQTQSGLALVLVLAMIVLLTIIVLAFFSKALVERQISASSSTQTKVDHFAQGAVDQIVGDLRQEILNGSISTNTSGGSVVTTLYRPETFRYAIPQLAVPGYSSTSITNSGLENLLKISKDNVSFATNMPSRASSISSTTPSQNSRYVSTARWNKSLLLQKANQGGNDPAPVSVYTPPDWIFVSRNGTNPKTWNANLLSTNSQSAVVGRYAYSIYNEGGLLDINAAGAPSPMSATAANAEMAARKPSVAFADLTQVGLSPSQVDAIVGWRNYATAQPAGSFPSYSFPVASLGRYQTNLQAPPTAFLSIAADQLYNNQSDRFFTSRQQLIEFMTKGLSANPSDQASLQNSLRYLGTFSRSLDQPSYWPDPARPRVQQGYDATSFSYSGGNSGSGLDDEINPVVSQVRVKSAFTRNDSSAAIPGEPLMKKRFALERLAWITKDGPSATASTPTRAAYLGLGVPQRLLDEGTPANIYKYFGLRWTPGSGSGGAGGFWTYDHNIQSSGQLIIGTMGNLPTENREPDFFEVLKAAINAGSLSKGGAGIGNDLNDGAYSRNQYKIDTRIDFNIIQIGANIIDQASPDSFPTLIVFNDGTYNRPFWGKEDLPYYYGSSELGILVKKATAGTPMAHDGTPITPQVVLTDPGEVAQLLVPMIWNPHGGTINAPTSGPGDLRICISNVTTASPSSTGNTIWSRTFPRYVPPSGNGAVGIPAILIYAPWSPSSNNGTASNPSNFDPTTGQVIIANGANNTSLFFSNNPALYRQPVPLMRTGLPLGSNLAIDGGNILMMQGGYSGTGIREEGSGRDFLGFYVAKAPQRFNKTVVLGDNVGFIGDYTLTTNRFAIQRTNLGTTISLEYRSGTAWIPYQQYTVGIAQGGVSIPYDSTGTSAFTKSVLDTWVSPGGGFVRNWQASFDPRSNRWGFPGDLLQRSFIDTAKSITTAFRPTTTAESGSHGSLGPAQGWYNSNGAGGAQNFYGSVAQNIYVPSAPYYYYADPDGVVRRGMASAVADMSPASSVGLPNVTDNLASRPMILNRPFQSVGEMSYAFRDAPFRNIDFSTPESGDAALLDFFCIRESERTDALVGGRVDLNTRQKPVIQALLAGAYRNEFGGFAMLPPTEAATMAQALVDRTSGTGANNGPLGNIADLVGRLKAGTALSPPMDGKNTYVGYAADLSSYAGGAISENNLIQRYRETTMRALAAGGQAGTWNLMIDLIAQAGRFSPSAGNLSNFIVEGERRYWVHVAIDRQTGKVIDQVVEEVTE